MAILDDPERQLIVSDAVWLEIMPKPIHYKRQLEVAFYQAIFDNADVVPWQTGILYKAHTLAQDQGIAAMDAIHLATALSAKADEFLSAERPEKPMFRITEIPVRSIR